MTREQRALKKAATPLMEYLAKKHHPHVTVIVDSTHAELVEGLIQVRASKRKRAVTKP